MKLNREGVALNAEERNKRNQNWATLETEVTTVSETAKAALPLAEEALGLSGNLQAQINTLVVEGDSSVEARQARVDAKGVEAATLKARLDAEQNAVTAKLADKAKQSELEVERSRINNLTANAGDTAGNAELLDIRVGFDGVVYPTAGESTRSLTNYMIADGSEHKIFPPDVSGLVSSSAGYKGSTFKIKENRKLTYIGAKGVPVKWEVSEIKMDTAGKFTTLKVLSSGSFTGTVENNYSVSRLSVPIMLLKDMEYILTVDYGTSMTNEYLRTKSTEGVPGYDGNDDEIITATGRNFVASRFPIATDVTSNLFFYDYKIGVETYAFKIAKTEIETPPPVIIEPVEPLEGLRVGLLGSSTMDTSRTGVNFMEHIAAKTGLVLENYAVGGQSTTATQQNWELDSGLRGLNKTKQMITEKPDLDFVLVQPLINDEYLPLGTFDVEDPTTCYGAMHIIAKMLLEAYQEKPIGFITGQYFPAAPGLNTARESLRHKCIKEIGYYYGIPVLDLRAEGQTPYMLQWFKDKYVPDGTHLNDAGNKIIARPVEAFIRKITTGYEPA